MEKELIGYPDRWSVATGQTIRFMVSTDEPHYDVSIVRLIHANSDPAGPGIKEDVIVPSQLVQQRGRKQIVKAGSYIEVAAHPAIDALTSFSIQAWVFPTFPEQGKKQTILAQGSSENGFALYLDTNGCLSFRINGEPALQSSIPLLNRVWYFVAATYDALTNKATLYQYAVTPYPTPDLEPVIIEQNDPIPVMNAAPLYIAASAPYLDVFNGKIDHPRVFANTLSSAQVDQLRQGADPQTVGNVVANWDFSLNHASAVATDIGQHNLHGKIVNMPMRAVIGYNWTAREIDPRLAPHEYGAIHFHDDDLDDAGWEVDFELTIPDHWRSGIYTARLNSGALVNDIPFYVRPHVGKPTAQAAYLIPTMTYLAYGNYRAKDRSYDENGNLRGPLSQPLETYFDEHPEFAMSIYDFHTDGSGCCYSSRLRPMPNMHPRYMWSLVSGPRHFGADLYMVDWLETKNIPHDIFTDEDLHFDGLELLKSYKVVITGTHPEYWTTPMLDALEAYLAQGGRLMYLGGNGFYWITSVDPHRPHMVEVRRGIGGTRAWESIPGEEYHSTTGEIGGLWRHRGRAPNRLTGVGFAAQGWDGRAAGYMRQPDSFNPRASFIFEGIGDDEPIGNFGLVLGGAAGDEIDRTDKALGTPRHTLVVAASVGHHEHILPVVEDFNGVTLPMTTRENWNVRSEIIFAEMPNGGAIFSTGSIAWCGSLSHNNYQNNVSRMTENVLREFLR